MLSSSAGNLYWMARYVERAENTARLLGATHRMWLMSGGRQEWSSVATLYGCADSFAARHPEPTVEAFVNFMALDLDNPISIASCLRAARTNARAERNILSTPVWEYLNETWLETRECTGTRLSGAAIQPFLDHMKKQTCLVSGACFGTMLRDEAFSFLLLGTEIERADNTARILDVKYHILLPREEPVGGGVDYYQWSEILQGISALRTYRRVYSSVISPLRVAEMMILHADLPRSMHHCYREINGQLDELARLHGVRHESHRLAGEIYSRLRYARIDDLFASGLHEFLLGFVGQNNRLGAEIARNYLFSP
jgi:uncharacterized alpha-E superfamily protein